MKQVIFFICALLALGSLSCSKVNDRASGTGDAIVISKKIGADVVYSYSLYAYSFADFKKVSATNALQAGKTYSLKKNLEFKTNFYYEPDDQSFVKTKPVATTFTFNAEFENGATDEFYDEVSDKVLPIPVIEKTEYNTNSKELLINWAIVPGADSYTINILDDKTLVFGSLELNKVSRSLSVGQSSQGWINGATPVIGKTYTVKLNAFLYEPKGNAYNLQAVSVTTASIVWGKVSN